MGKRAQEEREKEVEGVAGHSDASSYTEVTRCRRCPTKGTEYIQSADKQAMERDRTDTQRSEHGVQNTVGQR
jgi:hypothetical protein